jgi:hypothetical protein
MIPNTYSALEAGTDDKDLQLTLKRLAASWLLLPAGSRAG